jgi:hypothetical protein
VTDTFITLEIRVLKLEVCWLHCLVIAGLIDSKQSKSVCDSLVLSVMALCFVFGRTRAVFVEFTLYNANVNLFQSVTFLVEFLATGCCLETSECHSI